MRLRALVFDDNEIVRVLLSTLLRKRGYEVRSFSEPGACALYTHADCNCMNDSPCADVLITDVRMPNVSGLEMVEQLLRNGCKIKNIAFVSGSWTEAEYAKAYELGCKIFQKPFQISEIDAWLEASEKSVQADRVLAEW